MAGLVLLITSGTLITYPVSCMYKREWAFIAHYEPDPCTIQGEITSNLLSHDKNTWVLIPFIVTTD